MEFYLRILWTDNALRKYKMALQVVRNRGTVLYKMPK